MLWAMSSSQTAFVRNKRDREQRGICLEKNPKTEIKVCQLADGRAALSPTEAPQCTSCLGWGRAGQDVGGDQAPSRQGPLTTQLVTRQGGQRSISDLWLEAGRLRAKTRWGATDGPWAWKASSLLFSYFLECITLYNPPTPTPSVRDQLNPTLPRQRSIAHTPAAGVVSQGSGLGIPSATWRAPWRRRSGESRQKCS